jgi:hypothetical protein
MLRDKFDINLVDKIDAFYISIAPNFCDSNKQLWHS